VGGAFFALFALILLPLALTLRFSFPNYVRPHDKTVYYFKYEFTVTY